MQFIDLKKQLEIIRPSIDKRIKSVLDQGVFIMGPEVQELEHELSKYCGAKHAVTCANGTDALQIALMALDVGPGDTVLTTAFSFFATAEVIPLVGALPFLVDIEEYTYNMCAQSLEAGIQAAMKRGLKPKAVIAVDMFGLPANYNEIRPICDYYQLSLVADGAQSFGAQRGSYKTGTFGDISTTSFFPAKPLGCFGDGGAIFTDNDEYAEKCRSIRVHGKGKNKYDNIRIGLNSRLDTIQAAVLLEKLAIFPQELVQRNAIACQYSNSLNDNFLVPNRMQNCTSAWAQYTLRAKLKHRDYYISSLKKAGIPSGIYYPKGLHKQPAFKNIQYLDLANTEIISGEVFSIPIHPYLTAIELENIINTLC